MEEVRVTWSMTRLGALFMVVIGIVQPLSGQDGEKKPAVSKEPLTSEQTAVYQAFLRLYAKGDGVIHVADTTEALDLPDMKDPSDGKEDKECGRLFRHLELELPKQGSPHKLDPRLAVPGRVVFVDAEQQSEKVRENDPSETMRKGKPVDRAVDDAFAVGLLTLSEIVFDKQHGKALMSFSFFCGRLCGHGAVILLKRSGRNWKVTKQSCGEWVS